MAGKCIPALPPSVSRIPGISNEQHNEELLCRQLETLMRELLAQSVCLLGENQRREAERDIPNLAREMCEVVVMARGAEVERSKGGKASLAGVLGQLRYIASGADTLLKRMKKADRNVFDAWADAGNAANDIPYHESIRRWLDLRRLLEDARERAGQAAQSVEATMKQFSRASMAENRRHRRPAEIVASAVAAEAAVVYQKLTGHRAVRRVSRDTGDPEGFFHDFLATLFKIFNIDSSPDYANAKLQADSRFLHTSGPGG